MDNNEGKNWTLKQTVMRKVMFCWKYYYLSMIVMINKRRKENRRVNSLMAGACKDNYIETEKIFTFES